MPNENDYEVGYGKPPEHSRFKPGRSGNPNGRPKKTKDLDKLFASELDQTIRVTEGGQSRKVTKGELIIKAIVHAALKGDHRAQKIVVGFMQKRFDLEGFEVNPAAQGLLDDFMKQWQQQNQGDGDGPRDTDH